MKQIAEYLMETLKVHSTQVNEYLLSKTHSYAAGYFPDTSKKDDVLDFLEAHDADDMCFSQSDGLAIDSKIKQYCKSGKSAYAIENYNNMKDVYWLRFMHSGQESDANPLLFCYLTDDGSKPNVRSIEYPAYSITSGNKIDSWAEFKKIVEKIFWES